VDYLPVIAEIWMIHFVKFLYSELKRRKNIHLVMRQQAKELFEATFVIGANNTQIGDMRITSEISRVGGDWTINYSGMQIALKRGKILPEGRQAVQTL
jgi:hypothetical protein